MMPSMPTATRHPTGDTIPIEALFDAYPPAIRDLAEELRAIVLDALPDVTERVRAGWALLGFDLPVAPRRTTYLAFVAPEVVHVHLGFEHGAWMRDDARLLEGRGITKRVRWFTFQPGERPDHDRMRAYVLEAAQVGRLSRAERALLVEGVEQDVVPLDRR